MSKLRPELKTCAPDTFALKDGTAYYAVYQAVLAQPGLIHGRLHNTVGEHCAIGSYFAQPGHVALYNDLIDEVAAVNDSAPTVSPAKRKAVVVRWLRWKLAQLGLSVGAGCPSTVSPPLVKKQPKRLAGEIVK